MKLSTASFFAALTVLGAIIFVSSCSRTDHFAGEWLGTPSRMMGIPGASDATSTVSIDFAPTSDIRHGGDVFMSATIDVSQAVTGAEFSLDSPYQVDVAATASIRGHYIAEDDDNDDILLNLDPSSLQVNIDPAGVTFSENILTGLQRPALDSLTNRTIDAWRVLITSAIRDEFYKYQKIEDIKVHHSDMMSCEVGDRDCTFRRVAPN
ncbi:MAG: hypothetical protein K2I39_08920 [Muribaculaceae bacterium]|nr:hypothetical protein [Muribaculaceae bacterium]